MYEGSADNVRPLPPRDHYMNWRIEKRLKCSELDKQKAKQDDLRLNNTDVLFPRLILA